jgi:succinyl-CoA synthetase alpha subunit
VAGVNPKKAGEDFEGIPIYASVKEAKEQTGATVSVIYVPPAGAAAAIWEAVEADLDLAICITEGIPVRDMLEVKDKMRRRQEDAAARPELPRPDHAGRNQDRHHAGSHPPQGPHRRGVALGHADL